MQKSACEDFVNRVRQDETGYDYLLRQANYTRASDAVVSPSNPYGLIFSEEKCLALLRKGFADFKRITFQGYAMSLNDARIKAKLKPGTTYSADRIFNTHLQEFYRGSRSFAQMSLARRSTFPLTFRIVADNYLFVQGLAGRSVSELEKETCTADLEREMQRHLFRCLTDAQVKKEALFLASFKKGLTRLMAKS